MTGGGKFAFTSASILGRNGTPVYPVVSGTVGRVSREKHREYVEILTGNGRSFEYWHVRAVVPGPAAEAGATGAGMLMAPFEHVHFAEIKSGQAVNPLASGRLTPYTDTTRPRVESISLRRTRDRLGAPTELRPGSCADGRRGVRHAPAFRSGRMAANARGSRARHMAAQTVRRQALPPVA